MFQGQTFQPGTITEDMMRFTARPVASIARPPGTPAPPRMFTDQLTGKEVTQAEIDSLGGMQTFLDPNAERARAAQNSQKIFGIDLPNADQKLSEAQLRAQPAYMSAGRGAGMQGIPQMGTALRSAGPDGGMGGISNRFNPPQQRGGMFNQQNQFNPQGMQQMMQFMQQMMQMFSMMSGQNRGGGFGGGFGGQQQYQQPQRYQPQPRQQYQPPPRQQFQPVQQQYGQMGPQQPSPFAQSIRPRY